MSTATAYTITSEIVSTAYFTLHTAAHPASGEQYLIKNFFKQDAEKITTLRNGVKLAAELQLDAILDPVELFEENGNVTIVYRYFNACTLRHLIQQKKKFTPGTFLQAAEKLTQLLLVFHTLGWIIKNLSPDNILMNETEYSCKLADLRRASRVYKKESSDIYEKAGADELHYISPEQTGRGK